MPDNARLQAATRLAVSILALSAVGCQQPQSAEVETLVEGGPPLIRDVDITLRYPIELQADEQVSVKPVAVSGLLTKVLVDVGDTVKAGQLIAMLDCREYAAQGAQVATAITQRRAQLDAARKQLDRLQAMNDDDLLAPAELDDARASYRVAAAQLAEAQARRSEATQRQGYCWLNAPFDGYVSERILDPGAMVGPGGQPVVTIVKSRDVIGVASVIEQDVAKVKRDALAQITLHTMGNRIFNGRVTRVGRVLDPRTRTLPIEMSIDPGTEELMPGTTGRVAIVVEKKVDAVLLPVTAVLNLEEASYVFVVREKDGKQRAHRVAVELGEDLGDLLEIRSGIEPSDRIVMVGRELVADGARVAMSPFKPKWQDKIASAPEVLANSADKKVEPKLPVREVEKARPTKSVVREIISDKANALRRVVGPPFGPALAKSETTPKPKPAAGSPNTDVDALPKLRVAQAPQAHVSRDAAKDARTNAAAPQMPESEEPPNAPAAALAPDPALLDEPEPPAFSDSPASSADAKRPYPPPDAGSGAASPRQAPSLPVQEAAPPDSVRPDPDGALP